MEDSGGAVRLRIHDSAQDATVIAEVIEDDSRAAAEHAQAEALKVVRAPLAEAGIALPEILADVPYGEARLMLRRPLPGSPVEPGHLADEDLLRDVARTLAAIHCLPAEPAEEAGLPVYEAETLKQRHLDDLDRAAASGLVPPALLARWEHDLEDVRLWRFLPHVVHGGFSERCVLVEGSRVVAVRHWHELRVGDPAQDLLWVASTLTPEQADLLYETYASQLGGAESAMTAELRLRAELLAELDLLGWLLHGLDTGDQAITDDARDLLRELADMLAGDEPVPPDVSAASGSGGPAGGSVTGAPAGGGSSESARSGSGFTDDGFIDDEAERPGDPEDLAPLGEDPIDGADIGADDIGPDTIDAGAADADDIGADEASQAPDDRRASEPHNGPGHPASGEDDEGGPDGLTARG
nr:phosphotransferase [Sediminivirga luteola]